MGRQTRPASGTTRGPLRGPLLRSRAGGPSAAAAKNAALLDHSDTFVRACAPGSYSPDAQGDSHHDYDSPYSQFGDKSSRITLAYPPYPGSPNMLPVPVPAGAQMPSGQMLAPGLPSSGTSPVRRFERVTWW
jgi:hypothetical protein